MKSNWLIKALGSTIARTIGLIIAPLMVTFFGVDKFFLNWKLIPADVFIGLVALPVFLVVFDTYRIIRRPPQIALIPLIWGTCTVVGFYLATLSLAIRFSDNPGNGFFLSVFCCCIFIFAILTREFWSIQKASWSKSPGHVGFAVSGVLVQGEGSDAKFVLIRNLNLREGKGMWVPPGGHFDPAVKEPYVAIKEKILSEIGVDCELIELAPVGQPNRFQHETALAKAYPAPLFFLREDLQGECKEHHTTHIASVFACRIVEGALVQSPKYQAQSRAYVSVQRCAPSSTEAIAAVYAAIDDWARAKDGRRPGAYPDVPDDVPWRLHEVAKLLNLKTLSVKSPQENKNDRV